MSNSVQDQNYIDHIEYGQYKYLMEKSQDRESTLLLRELSKAQDEVEYYHQLYQQMKFINQSIIDAIKRVYSPEIGEQLQRIVRDIKDSRVLTQSLCDVLNSQSKSSFFQNKSLMTPPRYCKQQKNGFSPIISSHRSTTPKNIATELLCQLCDKTYPPSQFFQHLDTCKIISSKQKQQTNQSVNESSYNQMMKNLISIRKEIENQIQLLKNSKQKIDRATQRKKLQRDLAHVINVIKKKQLQISYKNKQNKPKLKKSGKLKISYI